MEGFKVKGYRATKTIAGEDYDYTRCPRCHIWILTEDFNGDTHEDCDRYFKTLEIRENAAARALGRLSS